MFPGGELRSNGGASLRCFDRVRELVLESAGSAKKKESWRQT